MFYERKAAVERQMAELQKTLDVIQYKCWYYDSALEAGTETSLQNMSIDELPEHVRKGKAYLEKKLQE